MLSFKQSLFILIVLLLIFFVFLSILHLSPHYAIITGIGTLFLFGLFFKHSPILMGKEMFFGLKSGIKPIIILLVIGACIGLFISSGFIPYCLYWGLTFFSPNYFLISSLSLCILISMLTGSSLTTGGTIGVALLGIGNYLGIDPRYTAASVICGAFFGDKMSPLSDTTNFAPALVGIDIFTHIKCMLGTTLPSLIISIIFFQLLPISLHQINLEKIQLMQNFLKDSFNLSHLLLFIPFCLIFLSYFKVKSSKYFGVIFVLCIGLTLLLQTKINPQKIFSIIFKGFDFSLLEYSKRPVTSDILALLNRGGIFSMLDSVELILLALLLGGLFHYFKIINVLLNKAHQLKMTKGPLITLSAFFSVLINIITGEQYLSIFIPAMGLKDIFEQLKIPKKYLARALEDGGTLINPLVPWSITGVFFSKTLGVSVDEYAPFCIFIYGCFFMTIFLGFVQKNKT